MVKSSKFECNIKRKKGGTIAQNKNTISLMSFLNFSAFLMKCRLALAFSSIVITLSLPDESTLSYAYYVVG